MFEKVRLGGGSGDVLVLGHFKGRGLSSGCRAHDADGVIGEALRRKGVTGDVGSMTELFGVGGYERVLVIGLGERGRARALDVRAGIVAAAKRVHGVEARGMTVCLAGAIGEAKLDAHEVGCAVGEALALMTYDDQRYRGSASSKVARRNLVVHVDAMHGDDGFEEGIGVGFGIGEGVNVTREFSAAPPNLMNPVTLAAAVKKMARATGLKCDVIAGDDLLDHGLVGIHNVGMASETPGCLVRLEYTPSRGRGGKPLVLVGKTMTYDSGGLSIKVGGNMRGMKQDMDGGAAVIGAMHAIATTVRPRRRVVAYLACAENAISDEAYRPDDILTFANGVTVEVTNTDAEGRLVLADALVYACERDNPEAVVDIATLTGGVVVALGKVYTGMWCEDGGLRDAIHAAGARTGEKCWHLPMDEPYRKMMRSETADVWNSAPVREAHPIQGAAFLSFFVNEGVRWAHLDIAGTHGSDDPTGAIAKGSAPGYGARLLARLAEEV